MNHLYHENSILLLTCLFTLYSSTLSHSGGSSSTTTSFSLFVCLFVSSLTISIIVYQRGRRRSSKLKKSNDMSGGDDDDYGDNGILSGLLLFPLLFFTFVETSHHWLTVSSVTCSISYAICYMIGVNSTAVAAKKWITYVRFIVASLFYASYVVFQLGPVGGKIPVDRVLWIRWLCMMIYSVIFDVMINVVWKETIFRKSCSLGEAMTVSHGLSAVIFLSVEQVLKRIGQSPSDSLKAFNGDKETEIQLILSLLLCTVLFISSIVFISNFINKCKKNDKQDESGNGDQLSAIKQEQSSAVLLLIMFLVYCALFIVIVIVPLTSWTMQCNSVRWLSRLVRNHIVLLSYWCFCLFFMSILMYFSDSKQEQQQQEQKRVVKLFNCITVPNIVYRKMFHLIAVTLFVPATLTAPDFMCAAYTGALILFLLVETLRFLLVQHYANARLTQWIDTSVRRFTDEREDGPFVLTHIYLLVGCMIPALAARYMDNEQVPGMILGCLLPLVGVFTLGVGDTMASLVGVYKGKNKWSTTSNKTLEGTFGAIISVLFVGYGTLFLFCRGDHDSSYKDLHFAKAHTAWIVSTALTCILEANTSQIDNLILPLFHCVCIKSFFT